MREGIAKNRIFGKKLAEPGEVFAAELCDNLIDVSDHGQVKTCPYERKNP
ncbi:MAG: hypothetical protein K8I30_05395 [Anaerolineae bacterium]|nr:hypothetical protein [Anaerolineae bacterium]